MAWVIRILLFLGGMLAGIFVGEDSNTYPVASFVASLLLLTAFIALWAFWPTIRRFWHNAMRKD